MVDKSKAGCTLVAQEFSVGTIIKVGSREDDVREISGFSCCYSTFVVLASEDDLLVAPSVKQVMGGFDMVLILGTSLLT